MKNRLVLASNSPRRKELLRGLGIDFEVRLIGDIDESYPNDLPANEVPVHISKAKAAAYMDTMTENEVILTADTVVVCDGEILGKPHDAEDARRMLGLLSGKSHEVITGVTLSTLQWQRSFAVTTVVWFKELSADEISFYVVDWICRRSAHRRQLLQRDGLACAAHLRRIEGVFRLFTSL